MQPEPRIQEKAGRPSGIRISKLNLVVLLMSLLLLWLVFDSLGRARKVTEQAAQVSRTLDVANQIERVNTGLRKAQAATRGYLISAEPKFKGILTAATADLAQAFARLDAYPRSSGKEAKLLRIKALTDTILALQDRMIQLRATQGPQAAAQVFGTGQDHLLISEAERLLGEMRAEEQQELRQRQQRLVDLEKRAQWVIPVITLTGFLLVLVIVVLVRRDMRLEILLRRRLSEAHAASEERVRDATRELHALNGTLAKANDALRAQEARYRHLFEHAEVSIWEEDFSEVMRFAQDLEQRHAGGLRAYLEAHPEAVGEALGKLRVLNTNHKSLALFGASSKTELLEGVTRTFLPESMPVFGAQLCALAAGSPSFVSPAAMRTLTGERREVLVCVTFPHRVQDLTSVPVCLVDITDSVRVAQSLQRSERRLRAIFEQAADGIFVLGPDLQVLEVNAAGARMYGYDPDALIGMPVQDLLTPRELARLELAVNGEGQGEARFGERELRRRDGSTFPAEVDVRIIAPGIRMAMVHDISVRREAEHERQRHGEALQKLSARLLRVQEDERRALALELHDELGQKLAVLRITLAALRERITDPGLRSNAQDSFNLASELITRVRATALNLRPAMLDAEGLVNTLAWHIREQSKLVGIPVSFHAEPLPHRPDPLVEVAAFRMVQESLTNAVKHANARHIEVRIQAEDDWLLLQVRDDGAGFEGVAPGMGSGLSGIRDRAMLIGGKVTFTSAPGEGTCIDIALPFEAHGPGRWYW